MGEDHLFGTAGPDPDGWDASIEIVALASLPSAGVPGILQHFRVTEPGGGWKQFTYENPRDHVSAPWTPRMSVEDMQLDAFASNSSFDWPFETFENTWTRMSVPECYSFPFPPGEGFANFNELDAWIDLKTTTGVIGAPWQWSADLYIRDPNHMMPLVSTTTSNSFSGYDGGRGWWSLAGITSSQQIPIEQWFTFRLERKWSFPTSNNNRLFFDDVQVSSQSKPNYAQQFNALGGNRPNPVVNKWSDMRMRNLLLRKGNPASPTVVLDMPLTDNTCDLSPNANHGTPFNMLLPGCPA
jgi:hypothetical protein